MPPLLTQKAREEQEEKRVLKRLEEKRRKEQGVEVVKSGWKPSAADSALGGLTAAPKQPRTQVTKSGSRLVTPSITVNPPVVVKSGWKPSAEQQAEGGVKGYGTKDKTITILGVKYNRPSASDFQKGTKTPPTFMPDPNKIY